MSVWREARLLFPDGNLDLGEANLIKDGTLDVVGSGLRIVEGDRVGLHVDGHEERALVYTIELLVLNRWIKSAIFSLSTSPVPIILSSLLGDSPLIFIYYLTSFSPYYTGPRDPNISSAPSLLTPTLDGCETLILYNSGERLRILLDPLQVIYRLILADVD